MQSQMVDFDFNKHKYYENTTINFVEITDELLKETKSTDCWSGFNSIKKTLEKKGYKMDYWSHGAFNSFGSVYFINVKEEKIIRISDHFIGSTRSCYWTLDTGDYNRWQYRGGGNPWNESGRKWKVPPVAGLAEFKKIRVFEEERGDA